MCTAVKNCASERTICWSIPFFAGSTCRQPTNQVLQPWFCHKMEDLQTTVYSYMILWDINWENLSHWKESRTKNIGHWYYISNTVRKPQITLRNIFRAPAKKEAVCFSETVVSAYQRIRCHEPQRLQYYSSVQWEFKSLKIGLFKPSTLHLNALYVPQSSGSGAHPAS